MTLEETIKIEDNADREGIKNLSHIFNSDFFGINILPAKTFASYSFPDNTISEFLSSIWSFYSVS